MEQPRLGHTGVVRWVPKIHPFESKAWFRWAMFATSPFATVLTLILMISVGLVAAEKLMTLEKGMDSFLMMSRDAVSVKTVQRFGNSFSMGSIGAYQLVLIPNNSQTIYDSAFWADATRLLKDVVGELYEGHSKLHGTVASVMYSYNVYRRRQDGRKVSEVEVNSLAAQFLDPMSYDTSFCASESNASIRKDCLAFAKSKNCNDLGLLKTQMAPFFSMTPDEMTGACFSFQKMLDATTTPDRKALYATLAPSFMMGSRPGVEWTRNCRALLSNSSAYPTIEAHLAGFTAMMLDAINGIYDCTPMVVSVTMGLCFILVCFLIVSLAFGLSSVILIAWTIVAVFAMGIAVYQDGLLGSNAPKQLADTGGLAWIVPPLTFTVILGLGLDYDIFLLGRVCEYRMAGYSDRQALAYGVAKTGPVITSAGVIMAVAFGGLMLSEIPMLNQVSVLLVVAVLVDTFFVRTLATPALHAPLGSCNWWPRRVPAVSGVRLQDTTRCCVEGSSIEVESAASTWTDYSAN